jgi:hypothetical protein
MKLKVAAWPVERSQLNWPVGQVHTGGPPHAMLERDCHRAAGAEVSAVLGERMPHLGDATNMVVGHAIDVDRRAADDVALVADLIEVHALEGVGGLSMLRLLVSAGMIAALAWVTASLGRGFAAMSLPPWRVAAVTSRIPCAKILPRFSPWRALRCWILVGLECPAMAFGSRSWHLRGPPRRSQRAAISASCPSGEGSCLLPSNTDR